ncbi:hypothetical protein STEG23_001808, partial [Scotinomys teguina]
MVRDVGSPLLCAGSSATPCIVRSNASSVLSIRIFIFVQKVLKFLDEDCLMTIGVVTNLITGE